MVRTHYRVSCILFSFPTLCTNPSYILLLFVTLVNYSLETLLRCSSQITTKFSSFCAPLFAGQFFCIHTLAERAALCHNGFICLMQCKHPIRMGANSGPAATLLIQLSAGVPGKRGKAQPFGPLHPCNNPMWGSWLLGACWHIPSHCSYFRSEPVVEDLNHSVSFSQ